MIRLPIRLKKLLLSFNTSYHFNTNYVNFLPQNWKHITVSDESLRMKQYCNTVNFIMKLFYWFDKYNLRNHRFLDWWWYLKMISRYVILHISCNKLGRVVGDKWNWDGVFFRLPLHLFSTSTVLLRLQILSIFCTRVNSSK